MNNSFEDRLRDGLVDQSNQIEIAGAGPTAAAERAASRAQRASILRGLVGLLVVAGLGMMAYSQFASDDGDQVIAADETTQTTAPDGASESAVAVEVADFAASYVEGGGNYFGRFLTDEGQLIQVTTKPGMNWEELNGNGLPSAVVVADRNGIVEVNDLPDNFSAMNVAYHDGVLFSVSTSPEKQVRDVVMVNRSDDKGRSWNTSTINLDPILDDEHLGVWQNASIAASSAGVLVTVESNYWTNYETLLPQYAYNGEEDNYFDIRPTATGVEVRDWSEYAELSDEQYAKCEGHEGERELTEEEWAEVEDCWSEIEELPEPDPIASYTWEELGIEPVPTKSQTEMFHSVDGVNFERVNPPIDHSSPYVMSSDSGFLLQAYETGLEYETLSVDGEHIEGEWEPKWFASDDGRNWDEIDGPPGNCGVSGGAGLFLSQDCESNDTIYLSRDGGRSWTEAAPVPVSAPEGYMNYFSLYAGELGMVAIAHTEPDYMLLEQAMMESDARGLTHEEMEEIERGFMEDNQRKTEMYFSPDGNSWRLLQTPVELEGKNVWVNQALVGKNVIVISYGVESLEGYTATDVFLTPS